MNKHRTLIVALAILPPGQLRPSQEYRVLGDADRLCTTLSSALPIRAPVLPAGTPSTTVDCVRFSGVAGIPGLGRLDGHLRQVVRRHDLSGAGHPAEDDSHRRRRQGAAQGRNGLPVLRQPCAQPAPCNQRDDRLRARESSRERREASSSRPRSAAPRAAPAGAGVRRTTRGQATCTVPGYEFDLTPPVLPADRARSG